MRRIVLVLAILCSTTMATAQDNELEQLKQEVADLRQLVAQLTERLEQLENKGTSKKLPTSKHNVYNPKPFSFYEKLPLKMGKVLPPRRVIQQHSFIIKSMIAEKAKTTGDIKLTFEIGLQNYSNTDWKTYHDRYTLRLKDQDLTASGPYNIKLIKGQRKTIKQTFVLKTLEPQEVRLNIESGDKENLGVAEFRITINN